MKNESVKNENNNKKRNSNKKNTIEKILETNNIKIGSNENNSREGKTIVNNFISIDEEDYKITGDFSYINMSKNINPFLYNPKNKNFSFIDKEIIFKVIFLITIDDDSLKSSSNLSKIFQYIFLSLNNLNNIGISNSQILICLLFSHFSYEKTRQELFPYINFYEIHYKNKYNSSNKFHCSFGTIFPEDKNKSLMVLNFYKENSSFVELHKFFYSDIINELMEENHLNISINSQNENLMVINWTNGKFIIDNEESNQFTNDYGIFSNIINFCSNKNILLNFDVSFISDDAFGQVIKYNLDRDKIINHLFWDTICSYPIDHRFYCINMDNKLYEKIKNYFNNINFKYSTELFLDYNLNIFLSINCNSDEFSIRKINSIKIGYSSIYSTFADLYYDYINKKGSEFCDEIFLVAILASCKNTTCWKIFQKIIILINLFIYAMKFLWFGVLLTVFYTVINDGLGDLIIEKSYGYFFVFFYGMVMTIFLFININNAKNDSRIKKNIIDRNETRNNNIYISLFLLYFLHYFYALFFTVCCILTIIHIKDETSKVKYYILVFLNVFLYILPYFFSFSNIFSRGFFLHLLIQLPNNFSFFYFPYIVTCNKNKDLVKANKNSDNKYIFLFFAFNGLITYFSLILDDQKRIRVDFFSIILIIFCMINGIRDICIIIGYIKECNFNRTFNKYIDSLPQINVTNNSINDITLINKNAGSDKLLSINVPKKEDGKKEKNYNIEEKNNNNNKKNLRHSLNLNKNKDKEENNSINEENDKYSLNLNKEKLKFENDSSNENNNNYSVNNSSKPNKSLKSFDSAADEKNQSNKGENTSNTLNITESHKLDKMDDFSNYNINNQLTNSNLRQNEKIEEINYGNFDDYIKNNVNKKIIDIQDLNQYYNEQYLESKRIIESINQNQSVSINQNQSVSINQNQSVSINKNQEDIYPEDNFPKDSEEYPHDTIVE